MDQGEYAPAYQALTRLNEGCSKQELTHIQHCLFSLHSAAPQGLDIELSSSQTLRVHLEWLDQPLSADTHGDWFDGEVKRLHEITHGRRPWPLAATTGLTGAALLASQPPRGAMFVLALPGDVDYLICPLAEVLLDGDVTYFLVVYVIELRQFWLVNYWQLVDADKGHEEYERTPPEQRYNKLHGMDRDFSVARLPDFLSGSTALEIEGTAGFEIHLPVRHYGRLQSPPNMRSINSRLLRF